MDYYAKVCNALRALGLEAQWRGTSVLLCCALAALELTESGDSWGVMALLQTYAESSGTTQCVAQVNARNALRRAGIAMTVGQAVEYLVELALVAADDEGYCEWHYCPVDEVAAAERQACPADRCRDCDWFKEGGEDEN